MVAALLRSGMRVTPIKLDLFKKEQVELACRFLQTRDTELLTPNNAVPLLQLGEFLQASTLTCACKHELITYVRKMDFTDPESLDNLPALFSVAMIDDYSSLNKAISERISRYLRDYLYQKEERLLLLAWDKLCAKLKEINAPIDYINLQGCPITDEELIFLDGLNIRMLDLSCCRSLTKDAANILGH